MLVTWRKNDSVPNPNIVRRDPKWQEHKEILAQNIARKLSAKISAIELFRALNNARSNSLRTISAGIFWGGCGALRICTILLIHSHPGNCSTAPAYVVGAVVGADCPSPASEANFGFWAGSRSCSFLHQKGKSFGLFWMLVCIICMPR